MSSPDQAQLLRQVRLALQNNDYLQAIRSLEQVVVYARERGDTGAEARHLGNLALTYYRLGQPEQALINFELALVCARREGDLLTENGLLGNMGNILREMGRHDQAIRYLNQALGIADEVSDQRGRGIWLSNLGLVYDDLRQPEQAIPLHEQAVEIARIMYDQPNIASRLGNLGNSYMAHQNYDAALLCFVETVGLMEQLGRTEDLPLRLGIIGNIYAHRARRRLPDHDIIGDYTQALTYYQRTLNIAREVGDRASEAELLRSIANILVDLQQYEDAVVYLQTAHEIFGALGLQTKAQQVRDLLARILSHLQNAGPGSSET